MNFSKMPRVYVSATMRSGSTLVSNILNAHSKIQIIENFHFKRFLYEDGKRLNKKLVEFKLREMGLRLKVRYKVIINEDQVIKKVFKKKLTYKNIYDELMKEQLRINPRIQIVGEDSAMNWRFIESFNKLYKNSKIIHLIRDPRSVFASWRKTTYQKNNYWGCIFNCVDNMNYASYYRKKLNKKNYLAVKFEDILQNPNLFAKKISKFLNIKFEKKMVQPKKWAFLFKDKFASLGWSSIEKKSIDGFLTNRINSWKSHLNKDEISIIEYFSKKNLKDWNYKISQKNENFKIEKFKKIIQKNLYLKKNFNNLKKTGQGSDKLQNNVKDPRTWGDGKNNKKKFIDSADGKYYMNELKKIKSMLNKKY